MKTMAEQTRDNYYKHLMKKYNEYDIDNLIDMITEHENIIREQLELDAMELSLVY